MRVTNKVKTAIAAFVCASTIGFTIQAHANERVNIQNESIYDVLVDRFFDKNSQNNFETVATEAKAFSGGDFEGIETKVSYFDSLDFTFLSLGSILEAEDYRGKLVTNYQVLQKNFGTKAQYNSMYKALHSKNIKVMADFPINGVSEKNTFIPSTEKEQWVTSGKEAGTVNWRLENEAVQKKLIDAAVNYVRDYKLDGIRLSTITDVDTKFLNAMIEALKKENSQLIVIADSPSNANFDVDYDTEKMSDFQQIFKNNNLDSSNLTKDIAEEKLSTPKSLMLDDLNSSRFTYFAAQENMFPPTRVKIAIATALTLPGTPVMSYGTEITMNGEAPPETLQEMDFRTKDDIITYIGQIQALRNGSNALRNGDFKLIENDNGFIVFERSTADEKWLIVVNNTDQTQSLDIAEDVIGKNKELYGMLEKDIIRVSDSSTYKVGIERELVEIYQVKEKQGINTAYLVALGLVYVLFIAFIVAVLKRGKKKRAANESKSDRENE